jgi:hypothetical protein
MSVVSTILASRGTGPALSGAVAQRMVVADRATERSSSGPTLTPRCDTHYDTVGSRVSWRDQRPSGLSTQYEPVGCIESE